MALGICPRLARHIPLVPNGMFGTKCFYMLFTTFSSTSEIFGLRTETSETR